jgi:hypothetical protein
VAVWLEPFPLSAKDPGYMLSAPAPVLIDRGLNWNDVVSGDGPFSDSNGQHSHCITEKGFGRQPKMKKSEKNYGRMRFDRKIGRNLG